MQHYQTLQQANSYIAASDGTRRYSRYEIGVIDGRYRAMPVLVADKAGFDGLGFDASVGSGDDHYTVLNLFDGSHKYIDSVAVVGADDDDHAAHLALSQFDYLGADYATVVVNDSAQFDDMSLDALGQRGWSSEAIARLMNHPSQDTGYYLPIINSKMLRAEQNRVTADNVMWDGANLVSHGSDYSRLLLDLQKHDAFGGLTAKFDMRDLLADLGATELGFDALMETYSRLDAMGDRLFTALGRHAVGDLTVTNVTTTKPFKRQGVANVAMQFDLSDGQTFSIIFHNPDADPKKLAAGDTMVSWKWLLNKKDVTAAVSPKQSDKVRYDVIASRIMKVAAKNSKRFVAAQMKKAQNQEKITEAQKAVDDKQAYLEQLDKDIAELKQQIDDFRLSDEAAAASGVDSDGDLGVETNDLQDGSVLNMGGGKRYTSDASNQASLLQQAIMPRHADSVSEAQALIKPLVGKSFINQKFAMEATISGNTIGKLGSKKATEQSATPRLHAQAVANIDILFERAIIKVTHDDKKNRINVEHVHRLGSIMLDESTGAYVPVMITVIEYKHSNEGTRIYSVEAVEIEEKEKPAGQLVSDEQAQVLKTPIADFKNKIAKVLDEVKQWEAKISAIIADGKRFKSSENSYLTQLGTNQEQSMIYHYLATPLLIDGKPCFARVVIREDHNNTFYWDLRIKNDFKNLFDSMKKAIDLPHTMVGDNGFDKDDNQNSSLNQPLFDKANTNDSQQVGEWVLNLFIFDENGNEIGDEPSDSTAAASTAATGGATSAQANTATDGDAIEGLTVDKIGGNQAKGNEVTHLENQAAQPHPNYSQDDIDYLNRIIAGDIDPLDADMDKIIEIGEKNETEPLFEQALQIISDAEDKATAGV